MSVVVDASVVLKWFVPEVGSEVASRLLASEDRLAAPDLLFAEIANAIWKKVLRGQLTHAESQSLIRDIENIAVNTTPCRALANDAHVIALITSRSVYDSMYVALALRLDTRVITADERFFHALQSFTDLAGSIELLA
ncbi:MAG: PIN domain nuclease [Acidobacteria bacterium]|nr:MAG: PIN domain nuclease [Acidobacteriota bacterium]